MFLFNVLLLAIGLINVSQLIYCAQSNQQDELMLAVLSAPLGRTKPELVIKAWNKYRDEINIDLDLFTSGIASQLDSILSKSNVSDQCQQGLLYLFDQAKLQTTWALKALDSWGRWPSSGLFSGTTTSFGSFDQCLGIETTNSTFETQYCTIILRPMLPERPRFQNIMNQLSVFKSSPLYHSNATNAVEFLKSKATLLYYTTFRIGICITNHCHTNEIDQIAKETAKSIYLNGQAVKCESKPIYPERLNFHQIIALSIISTILLVTLIGTLAELNSDKNSLNGFFHSLLYAFSIRRNFKSIFKTETTNNELRCLNGIRTLTIAWIIFGHTIVYINYHAVSNSFNIADIVKPFGSHILLNVSLTVDTFFLISGLLTSYITWKTTNGVYKNFNSLAFLISRYTRLTPFLVAAMCLTLFLPYMGSGPIWHEFIDPVIKNCEKNWWINLLYLQAFVRTDEICLIPTWWLSNDMFFHILSLIILIPLMRSTGFGVLVNILLILIFTISSAIVSYPRDYPPAILSTYPQVEEFWFDYIVQYFWKPYLHGPPFFIGLHLGFLLAKKRIYKMSKRTVNIGLTISMVLLFSVVAIPYPLTLGETWPKAINILFDCTNRIIWSLAISWIIYVSAIGHENWIGSFLSLPVFGPTAKITYAVYLTHMLLIRSYMGSKRELIYTSSYEMVYMFISHWFLAQILGTLTALIFESPFLNIQKLVAARFQKNDKIILKEWDNEKCDQNEEPDSQRLTPF